jgi:hypothetical protein
MTTLSTRPRTGKDVVKQGMAQPQRSTREVFESHLRLRKEGKLEEDLALNYAPDVVQLTAASGVRRGHDGVRAGAQELREQLPNSEYRYVCREVEGEIAFLVWEADSTAGRVRNGVDTFLIRGGKIVLQTIQYCVEPRG